MNNSMLKKQLVNISQNIGWIKKEHRNHNRQSTIGLTITENQKGILEIEMVAKPPALRLKRGRMEFLVPRRWEERPQETRHRGIWERGDTQGTLILLSRVLAWVEETRNWNQLLLVLIGEAGCKALAMTILPYSKQTRKIHLSSPSYCSPVSSRTPFATAEKWGYQKKIEISGYQPKHHRAEDRREGL